MRRKNGALLLAKMAKNGAFQKKFERKKMAKNGTFETKNRLSPRNQSAWFVGVCEEKFIRHGASPTDITRSR